MTTKNGKIQSRERITLKFEINKTLILGELENYNAV